MYNVLYIILHTQFKEDDRSIADEETKKFLNSFIYNLIDFII